MDRLTSLQSSQPVPADTAASSDQTSETLQAEDHAQTSDDIPLLTLITQLEGGPSSNAETENSLAFPTKERSGRSVPNQPAIRLQARTRQQTRARVSSSAVRTSESSDLEEEELPVCSQSEIDAILSRTSSEASSETSDNPPNQSMEKLQLEERVSKVLAGNSSTPDLGAGNTAVSSAQSKSPSQSSTFFRRHPRDSAVPLRTWSTPARPTQLFNYSQLVITPLTDRAYRTIISAKQHHFGAAPQGPAGTGKTETTRDLARALGMNCVVVNSSDQIDEKITAQIFKGALASGSWVCFDEFNSIVNEVLVNVGEQLKIVKEHKEKGATCFEEFCGTKNLKARI